MFDEILTNPSVVFLSLCLYSKRKSKRKVRLVGDVWVCGVMTGKEESNEKEEVQEGADVV